MIARYIPRSIVTGITLMALAACAPQPERSASETKLPEEQSTPSVTTAERPSRTSIELLNNPMFTPARRLLANQDYEAAVASLVALSSRSMSADDVVARHIVLRRLLEAENRYQAALESLADPYLNIAFYKADVDLQNMYIRESSDLLSRTGNHAAAADLLIAALERNPRDANSDLWINQIWRDLSQEMSLSPSTEHDRSSFAHNGWYSLAALARGNTGAPGRLLSLEQWQLDYAGHPALPIAAALHRVLEKSLVTRPTHVALLLPLTGRLSTTGQAVREGFLASSFHLARDGQTRPTITIYDTAANADVVDLYRQAVAEGAELVVGPLLKTNVRKLIATDSLPVPVLSLNRVAEGHENLFQLSLSPEDEAQQLARIASLRTPGNALLIRPRGAWGDKVEDTLRDSWQQSGNVIPTRAVYGAGIDLSTAVKQALDLTQSEERAKELARIVGLRSEFTPRRRADIDTVFILSSRPEETRTIRPMLSFHYAGDIPVYAMSGSSGAKGSSLHQDLEGLIFTELPWEITAHNPIRKLLLQNGGKSEFSSMYALGSDAYLLHTNLSALTSNSIPTAHGSTGILNLADANRFVRTLPVATVKQGGRVIENTLPMTLRPAGVQFDSEHTETVAPSMKLP